MAVTAAAAGRNLSLTVDGIDEPFIITPLPGFAGERATQIFIETAAGLLPPDQLAEVWQLALDGVDADGQTIIDGPNWTRVRNTLSMHEGENVIHPAFFWQTTLGMDGVNEFLEVGGGLAGAKKALERLMLTLGISPMQTSPSLGLEILTRRLVGTPPTSTQSGGSTLDKLPPSKRLGFMNRKQRRAAASPQPSSGD